MNRLAALVVLILMMTLLLTLAACNGPRRLKKGESLICPSCGAEFTLEECLKNQEKK